MFGPKGLANISVLAATNYGSKNSISLFLRTGVLYDEKMPEKGKDRHCCLPTLIPQR